MEAVFLIPLLVLLAILVGSVLGFVAYGRTNTLKAEVERLTERLQALEAGRIADPAAAMAATSDPAETVPAAEALDATAAAEAEDPTISAAETPTADISDDVPAADPAARPAGPPPIPGAARKRDFEEAIGTRWAVWVGGLALALGGVLLVRYSVEAGLLGPAARIGLALLLAAALLAVGEWLRRSGLAEPVVGAGRSAYVPGILTAAGTVTAFAAVYAAYVLYGFLGDAAAFLVLGAIALATLALALLHGPGLAGLGLAATYLTPLLVSSDRPAYGALSVYLLVVTVATLGVARLKGWRWLAIAAVAGTVGWSLLMSAGSLFSGYDGPVIALFTALAFALAHLTFVVSIEPLDPGRVVAGHDGTATTMLGLFALPVLMHVGIFDADPVSLALLIAYAAALVATVYGYAAVRLAVLPAALTLLVGYGAIDAHVAPVLDPATGLVVSPDFAGLLAAGGADRLIGAGLALGLLFAGLGLFGVLGAAARSQLAVAGTLIPLGLLVIANLRIADFEVSIAFGLAGLMLAAYFAAATEALIRRLDPAEHGVDGAIAVFAVAAVAALAAALAMAFERGVLTLALAAVVPAIALVEASRPVRGLRPVALVVATIVCARFAWDPAVVGGDLGTTPVFNWLLVGYGGPAAAFAYAAVRFGRTRMDPVVPVFEALAVAFVTLTAVMLIHHGMNGGTLDAPVSGLAEQSLITMTLLAVSLGLQWLALRRPSVVFAKGTLVLGALGLLAAAGGLLVTQNPFNTFEPIDGGAFDGTLILGYLLPALMAGAVAALAARRPDRPDWYVMLAGWIAGLLAFTWVTFAVRAAFHPTDFALGTIDEGELYAYSAVWLTAAIALLVAGALARVRAIRLVATVLLIGVVLKVFILDTAELSGLLRSASLVGLGLVLIPLGLAYQRLLRRVA